MVWRSRACLAAGPPTWTGIRLNAVVANSFRTIAAVQRSVQVLCDFQALGAGR